MPDLFVPDRPPSGDGCRPFPIGWDPSHISLTFRRRFWENWVVSRAFFSFVPSSEDEGPWDRKPPIGPFLPISSSRKRERGFLVPMTSFLSLGSFRGRFLWKGVLSWRVGLACPSTIPEYGRSLLLLRSPKGPFPHNLSFNDPKVVSSGEVRIRIRGRSNDSLVEE